MLKAFSFWIHYLIWDGVTFISLKHKFPMNLKNFNQSLVDIPYYISFKYKTVI